MHKKAFNVMAKQSSLMRQSRMMTAHGLYFIIIYAKYDLVDLKYLVPRVIDQLM